MKDGVKDGACNIGISKTLRLNSTILRPNSTSFWDRMRKCLAAALNVEMSRLTRLLNSVSVNFPDSNTAGNYNWTVKRGLERNF